jgi:NADH-quinone oxidoreductase subunit E
MSHYIIELLIAMLLAFFIGCIIGCLLRRLFTTESASESFSTVSVPEERVSAPPPPPVAAAAPPATEPVREDIPAAAAAPLMGRPERPKGIAQARGGKADNLQRISGVGPKNERVLHNLGFFHFDQIAAWTEEQIAWVDDHLKFNGRIKREEWVKQAKLLAEGREEEFTRLYGTGGLKDRSGEKKSGERTRRS